MKKITIVAATVLTATLLVGSNALAGSLIGGNLPIDREYADTYSNFTTIDTNNAFNFDGEVTEWEIYAEATLPIRLLIIRNLDRSTGSFEVVGESSVVTPSALSLNTFSLDSPLPVQAGDYIGVYHESTGVVSYDKPAGEPWKYDNFTHPVLQTADDGGGGSPAILSCERTYSIQAMGFPTKAEILKESSVPGKGLDEAPGLQKPFNPDSNAGDHAGKPVEATDVKLVKKVTLKGPPSWAGGGQSHGKKKKEGPAATGILGTEATGDRFAVVVGIADYPGEENDLNYTDDDAFEMAKVLTDVYAFTHVTPLLDLDATRTAILGAIEDIERDPALSSDDEVVFFFSGHGMRGHADDGDKEGMDEAIAAHDGTKIVPIWDGELAAAFSGFGTSRIIFIFDTCLAGGMKKDLEAPGRVIAMATSEKGYAYESNAWENGEFSYYFVDLGTLQGLANIHDYYGNGTLIPEQVTIEEAFDYAKANCDYDKPTIGDNFEDDLLP